MKGWLLGLCAVCLSSAVWCQAVIIHRPAGAVETVTAERLPAGAVVPDESGMGPGIGLFPPVQFPSEPTRVLGLRLSLVYSRHAAADVLDLQPFVGVTDGAFRGIAVSGLWNAVGGDTDALQLAGVGNMVAGRFSGVQIAGILNRTSENFDASALQLSCVNLAGGVSGGLQLGVFNRAKHWSGVQIGVINVAENLTGVQIGVANIIQMSSVPFLPVFNASF